MGTGEEESSKQREQPVQRPASKKGLGMSSWKSRGVSGAGGKRRTSQEERSKEGNGDLRRSAGTPTKEPQDLTYAFNVF